MTISELLEMGEELEHMSDEKLIGYLTPLFPHTRPNAETLITEEPYELPEALRLALVESGQPVAPSTHDDFHL